MARPGIAEPEPSRDLGFGIGVRPAMFARLLADSSGFDFFEAVTEDFLGAGGERGDLLRELAARSPVVLHGLSMSIGARTRSTSATCHSCATWPTASVPAGSPTTCAGPGSTGCARTSCFPCR
ncbi:hypothetical protein Psuf_076720 [Phytohabitans suffuscus]|uniref:Uncharacterized protein n=1 Tax=Phytohabitans suffuscus TaxID=624315 RepID=A0A6F8YWA0_9ACTN|nr:hypothetical protein Psuf_076720 [Phytohabitans suffuscus]